MSFCFFIYGINDWDRPLSDIGNLACYCGHCHNQSAFPVYTLKCVTLFFIPVLPFYYHKRLKCKICGTSGKLSKQAIDQLKQGQQLALG